MDKIGVRSDCMRQNQNIISKQIERRAESKPPSCSLKGIGFFPSFFFLSFFSFFPFLFSLTSPPSHVRFLFLSQQIPLGGVLITISNIMGERIGRRRNEEREELLNQKEERREKKRNKEREGEKREKSCWTKRRGEKKGFVLMLMFSVSM